MIGKPYSGKLNVRFDEGELEIEPPPLRQFPTLPLPTYNGAAAELRAEGPSVLAACSAGAGGRTRGALRRGPVQPGACVRLNGKLTCAADGKTGTRKPQRNESDIVPRQVQRLVCS